MNNQGTTLTIPQSNVDSTAGHVWNNPSANLGLHGGISTSMVRSSFKRRSSDDASGEFLVGESSSMGAEAGIAKRRVVSSDVNATNNVNISSLYNVPANSDLRNFEAEIGHNALTSVSEMQHLREPAQTECFQSSINVQITTATTPQAFMHINRFSNGYTRGVQVPLPGHATLFFQIDRSPSVSSSETVFGATSSHQPFEYAPNYNVGSGNAPLQIYPFYFGNASEVMGPSHNQGNIQRNILLGPQPQIESGTASFVGNFPNPEEQYGSFLSGSVNVSNAPDQLIPQFDRYILPIERMSPELPSVDPLEILQQMERSFGVGNYRAENEQISGAISDIQADANSEYLATSATLDRAEMRRRLAAQVHTAMENLLAGRNLQIEVQGHGVAEERNEEANTRLTEEQIMAHIRHENFESVGEETPENKEECCICLEDYDNGEEVWRLDCMHRFHVNCIVQHNVCPICNRMALAIDQIVDH